MVDAIQLPQAPTGMLTVLPLAPSIPPTDQDVITAHEYVIQTRSAKQDAVQQGNEENYGKVDYAEAIRFEARVLANTGDGQPLWFAVALNTAMAPLREELNGVRTEIANLKEGLYGVRTEIVNLRTEIAGLSRKQADLMRAFARDSNYQKGFGPNVALQIVPSPDGRYLSECGLPPLDTIAAVENLTAQHRTDYLQNYYGQAPRGSVLDRKKLLLKALGCQSNIQE